MANEYLKRTPTSTGNRKVWTLSLWLKRNAVFNNTGADAIFNAANTAANSHGTDIRFRKDNTGNNNGWNFYDYNANAFTWVKYGDTERRDSGNWFHAMFVFDSTKPRGDDRVEVYINGVLDTAIMSSYDTNPSQNYETYVNSITEHYLGVDQFAGSLTTSYSKSQFSDVFLVDGQALTPDVFGFYKDGDGYVSVGSTQATDFRPGQWSPHSPRKIKSDIERRGGFGVNGFYLPMNDSSNFGADFHCTPDSIITLKGEDLPQPRNGAPTTSDAYVSQLRSDPYAANLVLAVPGIDNNTNPELVTNGDFSNGTTGWTGLSGGSLSVEDGKLKITETTNAVDAYAVNGTAITTEVGKTYTIKWTFTEGTNTSFTVRFGNSGNQTQEYQSNSATGGSYPHSGSYAYTFTATATQLNLSFIVNQASSYGYLSNVSVKEAVPVRDYSADIKGSGTNRTPTIQRCGVTSPVASYYGSAISMGGSGDYLYYDLDGSGANAYGTGDFTFECWFFAIEEPENWGILMAHSTNGSWANGITLTAKNNTSRVFTIYTHDGSSNVQAVGTTTWALNQWHHVVAERYNGQLTLYVNGVAEATRADTRNYAVAGTPASSAQYGLSIGNQSNASYSSNGYFQDVRVYRGVAKYKGGFDVSKPYTPVGFEGESWRQVSDTCKNNFATLNPLDAVTSNQSGTDYTQATHSNGNLTVILSDDFSSARGSIGISTGKYYWEIRVDDNTNSPGMGVIAPGNQLTSYHSGANGASYEPRGDRFRKNGVNSYDGTNNKTDDGLIVGVALDKNVGIVSFFADGTLLSNGTMTGLNALSDVHIPECFTFNDGSNVDNTYTWNFGQNPSFSGQTTAGTNADASGKGLFKYAPPTGFLALCEDNLPTPAIADPGDYFKTVLYTGDGNGGRSITGVGFQPDLVWIKERTSTSGQIWFDSVRGAGNYLFSVNSNAEGYTGGAVMSFDSDGYSTGDNGATNQSGQDYVAWCWKAGGPAITNTDGSINSQVSVNQTAGFSVVSWTSDGTSLTVGHGLNKVPSFIIQKQRNASANWTVYHKDLAATEIVKLDTDGDKETSSDFANTRPTSSVLSSFTTGVSGRKVIAYCWAEIEGFSKFGSYEGNGNADGPFVYCGFKPAWVMVKNVDDTGGRDWGIQDSSRKSTNPCDKHLKANQTEVENSGLADSTFQIDMLSNGFKVRNNTGIWNNSGETIIFMAFAESPFQTANAK